MVVCAPEIVPFTAVSIVIGKPSKTSMLLSAIELVVLPSNSCRKSAVSVLVPPKRTLVGLAVWVRTIHGLSVRVAPDPPSIPTRSQCDALGPVLQPHQLSPAFTTDADPPTPDAMEMPVGFRLAVVVLFTIRLNWRLSVPPLFTKMPPPPMPPLKPDWFPKTLPSLLLTLLSPL